MSRYNDESFPDNYMSGITHHIPVAPQINPPIVSRRFGPYRTVSSTSESSNRLSFRQPISQQSSAHRFMHGTINQYSQNPPNRLERVSQYRSTLGRSNQYQAQKFHPQYVGPINLQTGQSARILSPTIAPRYSQQNLQSHLQPSRTRMLQQALLPGSVLRQSSPAVLRQNVDQQVHFNHQEQSVPLPIPSPQYSQSPQPQRNSSSREINADQHRSYHQHRFIPSQRSIRIPRPSATDWTTYRINREGKRLSKTIPPPQGTYKASEGIGKTDYSDPRDFFAPTAEEQKHVWNALRPAREVFHDLTLTELTMEDMRCLSMGYNASWEEMKRKFVEWIFENFSPDLMTTDRVTTTAHYPSEILGYTTEGLSTTIKQQHNPKQIKYFVNGELAVNVEELLPKLERWYGLIEDHRYSPTWPYERERNAGGYLVQNRDCFACMHCRLNQILCHGFRENVDRKCTPCVEKDLQCSNEEV